MSAEVVNRFIKLGERDWMRKTARWVTVAVVFYVKAKLAARLRDVVASGCQARGPTTGRS